MSEPCHEKLAMRAMRLTAIAGAICCGILLANAARAQGTNGGSTVTSTTPVKPPVVVLSPDPSKLPADVRTLLTDFQIARDRYETQRQALLDKLQGATAHQREEIRLQLEADRKQYLAEATEFRAQLRTEIANLKLKIHDAELLRLISAGQGPTGVHKGH
jgi:hypothetical protein